MGCTKYRHREKQYKYMQLNGYDPLDVLEIWGEDRCKVHADILDELKPTWLSQAEQSGTHN